MDEDTFARVEKQRQELEDNVAKLRKSLRYWQTLEIDYEGLKEEFQGLPEDSSYNECLEAAKEFKPELVDAKELSQLLGDKLKDRKRPSQLVEVFSKRVDYVARNISTIRGQLSDAEKKRNALLLAQDPNHQDDAGLPLSEITEELDEDGKVISSKVERPGKQAPELLEVLRKAGVPDIKDGVTSSGMKQEDEDDHEDYEENTDFSQASGDATTSKPVVKTGLPVSTLTDTNRIEELSDDEDASIQHDVIEPVNPNDTEEDAALRQEMLQYGLGEVGAIVAELDLEDSGNLSYDEDEGDYLSDYDEDEDLYTDESEDERGATKNPVISERYKRQMEALSKKHGINDLKNLGPEPELPEEVKEQLDRPSAAEAARQAALARYEANKSVLKSADSNEKATDGSAPKRKRVAFASELDIAEEKQAAKALPPPEPEVHPVGDVIVERTAGVTKDSDLTASLALASEPPSAQPPTSTKKISRFKAARSTVPQPSILMSTPIATQSNLFPPPLPPASPSKPTPSGPPNHTISSTLVERPATQTAPPTDPTDFDEELHKREVAVEYQKLRNRKIHAQGGYVGGGEAENYGEELAPEAVLDENTGRPRKISRFKAARLKS